jgi:hypothetical protein
MYFRMPTQSGAEGWRPQALGAYPTSRRRVVRRARRPLSGLGDDASILQQVFAGVTGAPAAANVQQAVEQALQQSAVWTSEDCSGIVSGTSTASLVLGTGGGAAVTWANTALAAGASGPLAPIVLVAGAAMQVFGAIFAHHSAKVKQEQQIICAIVQSANDSFSVIDQALQQGAITPQQASASLDAVLPAMQQAVQPILKQNGSDCNAACFVLAMARGVIAQRKAAYGKIMPANAPAGSYQQTCQFVSVQGNILFAQCPDSTGKMVQTSFQPIFACNGFSNNNGNLQCTLPTDPAIADADAEAEADPVAGATAAATSFVNSLATSTGLPAVAIWGAGAFVAAKLLGII